MAASGSSPPSCQPIRSLAEEHERNENSEALERIRHALAWLTAAARPLTASECWLAVNIGARHWRAEDSKAGNPGDDEIRQIGRCCGSAEWRDDESAGVELKGLMSSLIQIDENKRVSLVDGKAVGTWLSCRDKDVPTEFAFEDDKARHRIVGRTCLLLCVATSSQLANVRSPLISNLVVYAWTHWARHLMLSGWVFQPGEISHLMDLAIKRILHHLLVSLAPLEKKFTGPINVHRQEVRNEIAGQVRSAQDPLRQAMDLAMALDEIPGTCERLAVAHETYKNNAHPDPEAPLQGTGLPRLAAIIGAAPHPDSAIDCLDIDVVLAGGANLFSNSERHHINALAELVRALRRLMVAVVSFDRTLRSAVDGASVLDVLYYTATFVEYLVYHPFRFGDVFLPAKNPFEVGHDETGDGLWKISKLIMCMVWHDSYTLKTHDELEGLIEKSESLARNTPAYVPPYLKQSAAWSVAMLLSDPSHVRTKHPRPLNQSLPLSLENSTFGTWVENTQQSPGLRANIETMDIYLSKANKDHMIALAKAIRSSDLATSLSSWIGRVLMGSNAHRAAPILAQGFLRHGLAHFAMMLLVAMGLYHLRSSHFPWFANDLVYDAPIQNIHLAWTEPEQIIAKHISPGFIWRLFMWSIKLGCDGAALTMVIWIFANPDGPGKLPFWAAGIFFGSFKALGRMELGYTIMKIGYLFWTLMTFEYLFVRSAGSISVLVAYYRILAAGEDSRSKLLNLLWEHWDKVLFHWWSILSYARRDIALVAEPCEILLEGQIRRPSVVIGGWVTLVAIYLVSPEALWMIMRWSRLVVICLLVLAVFLLWVTETLFDPLGFYTSTMALRRTGQDAEKFLVRKEERPFTEEEEHVMLPS